MKVAIICEGKSDAAVISNIVKAVTKIDRSDIQFLVPELERDETDLYQMRIEQFSNWTIVRQSCIDKNKISDFLDNFEGSRSVIIHLDSDTRFEKNYNVVEPEKVLTKEDIETLYNNISNKIFEWIGENRKEIIPAIAVQEIDAWVLTIYDSNCKETGLLPNTKERLENILNKKMSVKDKKKIFLLKNKFAQYDFLSSEFRKLKNLKAFAKQNRSLEIFINLLNDSNF